MIETLGQARDNGWKITARCAWGHREGLKAPAMHSEHPAGPRIAHLDSWRRLSGLDAGRAAEVPEVRIAEGGAVVRPAISPHRRKPQEQLAIVRVMLGK